MTAPVKRKLIEVALPLEAINRVSAREKSIRHGHPSTLHLWWARRPLAACRAVLFAQLVDDPSAHPERFPTEEAQAKERQRLCDLIERLVVWENARTRHCCARPTRRSPPASTASHLRCWTPSAAAGRSHWRRSGSGWRPTPATSTQSQCSLREH